jgi:hypothetical protein
MEEQAVLVAATSFLINADKLDQVDLREIVGVREEQIHWLFPIVVRDELDRAQGDKATASSLTGLLLAGGLERVISDPGSTGLLQQEDLSRV